MKLILIISIIGLLGFGYSLKDTPHKHIWVNVVSDTVEVKERWMWDNEGYRISTLKEYEEGEDIVCIECHEERKVIYHRPFAKSWNDRILMPHTHDTLSIHSMNGVIKFNQ